MDGHVLVVGGVGTGKSSCIAIPTLRAWKKSLFAIDIKGELHRHTHEHRKHKNIKIFNPLKKDSYGYNPFFSLYTSDNPSQEARAIAQAIIPLPSDTKEPFWIRAAQNIFTAAILHYSLQDYTFIETVKKVQRTPPKELIAELCSSIDPKARYFVNSMADMAEKTLSSVMTELSNSIVYFVTDPHLEYALSRDKIITPDDLEFGDDIYIQIPEHLLAQWETLLTLIVNQFLSKFEQRPEKDADEENDADPILFLLDELPRLGKISSIVNGLATLRSKKISICLIVQSLAQLDDIYGETKRKVISDTCSYKAILGATDADTQEYFSRLAGTYDRLMVSHGTSKGAFSFINQGSSVNTQEQEQRIVRPHEFGMLLDIILFTPFPMPYDNETKKSKIKSRARSKEKVKAVGETAIYKYGFSIIDRMIDEVLAGMGGARKAATPQFAPFCRVARRPYYAEMNDSANMVTESDAGNLRLRWSRLPAIPWLILFAILGALCWLVLKGVSIITKQDTLIGAFEKALDEFFNSDDSDKWFVLITIISWIALIFLIIRLIF
ncbi:MAG: type IV secretory system conjugative DNA transfer family protein [Defluviitaleaceae bacterium]|nr:type IV secretory system conjugative DNA transfer family protein [Defluviitaleaceae bacterium]